MHKEKILVWLSGGVDSAVAAALLLEQGYEVTGGFMKNYVSEKGNCTTYKDAEEAIKVANHLWIELLSFDLQKEYQEKIIDYIFANYEKGITPNPDVLCNSLIKFDVFLHKALELGFDKIATGHYARITPLLKGGRSDPAAWCGGTTTEGSNTRNLLRWLDHNKDQSYFLAGLNQFQLSKSLFPLGELTKPQVRALAKKIWLPNAERKDSQGLCFIGNVPIREFLLQRFPKKEGDIIYVSSFWMSRHSEERGEALAEPNDEETLYTNISSEAENTSTSTNTNTKVGTHQGAYFYTIGQKHGLGLNFKAYVYRIDIENNLLYVTDKDSEELKTKSLIAKDRHWITPKSKGGQKGVRTNKPTNPPYPPFIKGEWKIRYRQNPPVPCKLEQQAEGTMKVTFEEEQRAVAPGQIFVAYEGEICLGCGVIT